MDIVPGARGATMWVVEDGLPTTENVGDLWYVSARRGGLMLERNNDSR